MIKILRCVTKITEETLKTHKYIMRIMRIYIDYYLNVL